MGRLLRARVLRPVLLVIGAAVTLAGYVLDALQLASLGIPPWGWQVIGALIFFAAVAAILLDHYRRTEVQARRIEAHARSIEWLQQRWWELARGDGLNGGRSVPSSTPEAQRMSPLEIAFGEAQAFRERTIVHLGPRVPEWFTVSPYVLHRVGVRNAGPNTVDDVRLMLVDFQPQGAPFLPIPLRFMHDDSPDGRISQRGVTLHPGEIRHVDVVRLAEFGPGSEEIEIRYAVPGAPNLIPRGRYTFTVMVAGRNVEPDTRRFIVSVDHENMLHFDPVP